ncbi:type II toxin-antitoxin system ParD family antitoxin [Zhouia sp. PK063]
MFIISKTTSLSLGAYFDQSVSRKVATKRYKNVNEVIRAVASIIEK